MKKLIKLSALVSVLSVAFVACHLPKSNSAQKPDSVSTSTSTTVIDSVKKDTAGKVVETKKDSTVTTDVKKSTPEKK